ncbi:NUDIX hydrolase [Streptomyces amritsarensis]|uniref:NUDIX hydrolase n=1 Tax=Streptomyces amritsarensis TaxID=681158 RepID=A0ABX3G8S1_9ACTN|nr:NUDIX hydrolase [Streptomyces amritsarensis]OLZ72542.1 NUDIX hydrolase [Streptomyces amritsarensis]
MEVIDTWTGELACHLQAAHRMNREEFADRLGVHPQTVAGWHSRPGIVPRPEIQAALDTVYEKAPPPVLLRFTRLVRPPVDASAVQALRVAIAIVVRQAEVLLVQRRDGGALHWQFPAGVVKPGADSEVVAVQETRAETGVHCTVRQPLGSRLHPTTGVQADYLLCDHLMGEASNLDQAENAEVAWVPITSLTRFISPDRIYRPVLDALGVAA